MPSAGRETVHVEVDSERRLISRSPALQRVIRQIEQVVKALDVGTIQVNFKIGAVPNDAVVESMRRFGKEVIPHVRDL